MAPSGARKPPPLRLKHAQPRRWSVDEYHRLCDTFFGPDEPLELIEGQIVRMIDEDKYHWYAIARVNDALMSRVRETHYTIPGCPVAVSMYSEPRPDFVLANRQAMDARNAPVKVELAVEVSNRSLKYDREDKSSVYAAADISEYWIVNLPEHKLEVGREPIRLKGRGLRHGYKTINTLGPEDTVSPLCRPDVVIPVKELF
jgi:Uma2 family endonuclease